MQLLSMEKTSLFVYTRKVILENIIFLQCCQQFKIYFRAALDNGLSIVNADSGRCITILYLLCV